MAPIAGRTFNLGLRAEFEREPLPKELLRVALIVYDALYAWSPSLTSEHHGWYPEALQKETRT